MYAHAPVHVGSLPPLATLRNAYCAPLFEYVVVGEQSLPPPARSFVAIVSEPPKVPLIATRTGVGFSFAFVCPQPYRWPVLPAPA